MIGSKSNHFSEGINFGMGMWKLENDDDEVFTIGTERNAINAWYFFCWIKNSMRLCGLLFG